jgi:hypothetical protein
MYEPHESLRSGGHSEEGGRVLTMRGLGSYCVEVKELVSQLISTVEGPEMIKLHT